MADITSHPIKRPFDGWSFGALIVAALVLLPLMSVAFMALMPSSSDWGHLWATTMPRYLGNSLTLMISVGLFSVIIGTGTAWLVVFRAFPGRSVLQYALMMPLAIPSYIAAYALVDFLEYAGPLQAGLRAMFGWETARDYMFPEIRSKWAAVTVMSLSLYPYVYLFARDAFEAQGANAVDVSRALGCTPFQSFLRVSLPMARPAIVAGAAIVMMEVLNDFGTVEFFAIQTMTTGIFSLWLEAGDRSGAAEIACLMLAIVLFLLLTEKFSRKKRKFHGLSKSTRPLVRHAASGPARWLPTFLCTLPVFLGFVLPVWVLIEVGDGSGWGQGDLWTAALNTLWLGFAAALIAVIFRHSGTIRPIRPPARGLDRDDFRHRSGPAPDRISRRHRICLRRPLLRHPPRRNRERHDASDTRHGYGRKIFGQTTPRRLGTCTFAHGTGRNCHLHGAPVRGRLKRASSHPDAAPLQLRYFGHEGL